MPGVPESLITGAQPWAADDASLHGPSWQHLANYCFKLLDVALQFGDTPSFVT